MNIGENNCTKCFQRLSTVSSALQLGTKLVDWRPAGWEPGVAWQWWLAGFAALLCGGGGPLQPSVPHVCWFAEMAEPGQSIVLLPFSSNSHPKLVQGSLWQKSFCWYGFFSVWLLPHLCLFGAPGESRSPWQCLGWSLRLEGRAASCQIGSTLWENQPLVLGNGPAMFHPSWFKLSWWWLPAELERRCRWQIRVQANMGGKQGGVGGCSRAGQLFRWHSLSWGKAGHQTKSCQFLGFSHPGLLGVAQTVFDVLFGVVLLGHWDS